MHRNMHLRAVVLLLMAWPGGASLLFRGISDEPLKSGGVSASSVIFPVSGNVYPTGYYYVTINIGQPPKPYFLDIDTGSDLTWIQCDAPCIKCNSAPHPPYRPSKNPLRCQDPLCVSLQNSGDVKCKAPQEQCDYEVEYADSGMSLGVLLKDYFPLKFSNGKTSAPQLGFGCGYDQEVYGSSHLPFTDGVLGLGIGKSSILSQLSSLGLTKNIIGHCLSGQGQGYLFFGDGFLPTSGIKWLSASSQSKHYSLGPADVLIDGKATKLRGLTVVFDSGSTYTYLSSKAYSTLVSLIKESISGKQLKDAADSSLPVCWKGQKPFKSINDVSIFFKPLGLSFTNAKNVQFQLPPQSYLVVTERGNVCLGILNGSEVGLGSTNVIGDISMLDKLVVYDNERYRIGFAAANCNKLPKRAPLCYRNGSWLPAGARGVSDELCPAAFDS